MALFYSKFLLIFLLILTKNLTEIQILSLKLTQTQSVTKTLILTLKKANKKMPGCSRVAKTLQWGLLGWFWGGALALENSVFFWQKLRNFRPILLKINAIKTRHKN